MYNSSSSSSTESNHSSNTVNWSDVLGVFFGMLALNGAGNLAKWFRSMASKQKKNGLLDKAISKFSLKKLTALEKYLSESLTREQTKFLSSLSESLLLEASRQENDLESEFINGMGFAARYPLGYTIMIQNIEQGHKKDFSSIPLTPLQYKKAIKNVSFSKTNEHLSNTILEFLQMEIQENRCIYIQKDSMPQGKLLNQIIVHRFVFGNYDTQQVFQGIGEIIVLHPSSDAAQKKIAKITFNKLLTVIPPAETPAMKSVISLITGQNIDPLVLDDTSLPKNESTTIAIDEKKPSASSSASNKIKEEISSSSPVSSPEVTDHLLYHIPLPESSPTLTRKKEKGKEK